MKRVRISTESTLGQVFLDDFEISDGVAGYTVTHKAGEIPELTLDLLVLENALDGDAEVFIPEVTREVLIKLGWTPPAA